MDSVTKTVFLQLHSFIFITQGRANALIAYSEWRAGVGAGEGRVHLRCQCMVIGVKGLGWWHLTAGVANRVLSTARTS